MKKTMTHTPEPWEYDDRGGCVWGDDCASDFPVALAHPESSTLGSERKPTSVEEANMKRIVACVNACKGIEDPEKTIRELVEALRDYHDGFHTLRPFAETFARNEALLAKLGGGAK